MAPHRLGKGHGLKKEGEDIFILKIAVSERICKFASAMENFTFISMMSKRMHRYDASI